MNILTPLRSRLPAHLAERFHITFDYYDWLHFHDTSIRIALECISVDVSRPTAAEIPAAFTLSTGFKGFMCLPKHTYLEVWRMRDLACAYVRKGRRSNASLVKVEQTFAAQNITIPMMRLRLRATHMVVDRPSRNAPSWRLTFTIASWTKLPKDAREFLNSTKLYARP